MSSWNILGKWLILIFTVVYCIKYINEDHVDQQNKILSKMDLELFMTKCNDSIFRNKTKKYLENISARLETCDIISMPIKYERIEEQVPLAFSILVHRSKNKKKNNSFEIYFSDVNHLEFLIKKIYRPFNTYCIHIDSKSSNKLKKEVNRLMECIQKQSKVNNIKVFSEISVVWYEDTILLADLFCTKESISIWKLFIISSIIDFIYRNCLKPHQSGRRL